MKLNIGMVFAGLFVLAVAVGTVESGINRFSMTIGASVGLVGLGLLFFAEENHRNPIWLKRRIKYLIWKFCS